jgi:hypothetical protein
MSIRRRPMARTLALVFLVACASTPAAGTAGRTGDVVTRAELAEQSLGGTTLLDAIGRVRPRFLNERGTNLHGESEAAQVSINGGALTALSGLSRFQAADVDEVRYLSAADANLRFGLPSGMRPVLLVTLRAR